MVTRFWSILSRLGAPFLFRYNYARLRPPKCRGWEHLPPLGDPSVVAMLQQEHIETIDWAIDASEYRSFFAQAGYRERYSQYYPASIIEKSLEHFIAQKLLSLSAADVYIDVASEHSPVPEIYGRLYGCRTYAQDLSYSPGIHENRIGGSAAAMPIPPGFATKMALHCSFEHFESNADIGFVRECSRVLAPGGAVAIVPLYLCNTYVVQTDLTTYFLTPPAFEPDAVVACVDGWKNRHGRCYDAHHLRTRVIDHCDHLQTSVIHITNSKAIDPSCYAHYALLMRKV